LSFNLRASRWWRIQFLSTGIMVEKHQWRWANPIGLKKQRTKSPLGFIVVHFEDATGLILKGQQLWPTDLRSVQWALIGDSTTWLFGLEDGKKAVLWPQRP
jgi:hypothetical protein